MYVKSAVASTALQHCKSLIVDTFYCIPGMPSNVNNKMLRLLFRLLAHGLFNNYTHAHTVDILGPFFFPLNGAGYYALANGGYRIAELLSQYSLLLSALLFSVENIF